MAGFNNLSDDLEQIRKRAEVLALEARQNEELYRALSTQDNAAARLRAEARVNELEEKLRRLTDSLNDQIERGDGQARLLVRRPSRDA